MANTRKATGPPTPVDFDQLLDEGDRPEDLVPLCLRGSLVAEWHQLKAEYDALPAVDEQAMATQRAAKRKLAERMAALQQKMRDGTVYFRLRALPRKRTADMPKGQLTWHELVEAHPPRLDAKGNVIQRDRPLGVNADTFFEALIRATVVSPEMDDTRWAKLDRKLSDAQFEKLAQAAWNLNRSDVDIPFSRAVSTILTSDAGSRRQKR